MEISPRYEGEGPPIISVDGPLDDQRVPVLRQRRRLEAMLVDLDDEKWGSPTRCDGWSVQDVVAHLTTVNAFWNVSIVAGVARTPSRFLEGFDPAATPALLVEATRSQCPAEVREQFVASNHELLDTFESLDAREWSALAESPPGHVPIRLLAAHALWDSWVHERDIALPLGMTPVAEPDEVRSCLRYAAALSPGFAISAGTAVPGVFAVEATDPDLQFSLEIGESVAVRDGRAPDGSPCLRGRAVDLIDAVSVRSPLPDSAPAEWTQLVTGLATAFS